MSKEPSGLNIVEIELTNACNLNCKHCYVDKSIKHTLPDTKVFDLIDEISELGVHRLAFTGGEPLLLQNIFKFAKYAKSKKIPTVALMTNGLLISEKNIQELKIFDLIQLSIDVPPKEKAHFRIDYSNELSNTIDLLNKNGIAVHLQATIHRELIKKLDELSDFINEKKVTLGLNRLILTGSATNLVDEKLKHEELKVALEKITEYKKKNSSIHCSDPLIFLVDSEKMNLFKKSEPKGIMGGCIAGIATLYICSNADVFICPFVKVPIANVFNEKLSDIWFNNETLAKLRNRKNINGKCGNCEYRAYCGGCRGASLLKTQSLIESDDNCWL